MADHDDQTDLPAADVHALLADDRPLVRWITNIPTPYRNHRYRVVNEVFPLHGLAFEVWYMAWSERDRHWRFDDHDLDHPHRVWGGAHPSVHGNDMHANPTLLWGARSRPATVTIVAGWSSFTTLALPSLLPKGRTLHLLESESNELSVVNQTGIFAKARKRSVHSATGYVVPGPRARTLLEQIDPAARAKPVLELPNIVDEAAFSAAKAMRRDHLTEIRGELGLPRVGDGRQIWICPARLEPFKGLDRMLPLLRDLPVTLVVAGTGSQQSELERIARSHDLDVRFVGQQSQEEMVRLYAAADVFILPSLRDPNPLTPIEALAAGLPVIVSVRAGNVDEVVADEAGWRYDPDDPTAMHALLSEVAALDRDALAARGAAAAGNHTERFGSVEAIGRFASALAELISTAAPSP